MAKYIRDGDYVERGTCGSCADYEYEGENEKGRCDRWRRYYYPNDSCKRWSESSDVSHSGCFLTSACCAYKGLPDDCDQLQALRRFRDTYLAQKEYGDEMIQLYYKEAPRIVARIDQSEERDQIYEELFKQIARIVSFIEAGKTEEAVAFYMLMCYRLKGI